MDALGAGGNLEQTVIYSQDSFLPRSASFNLTAEVFGHNVNVFEVIIIIILFINFDQRRAQLLVISLNVVITNEFLVLAVRY